MSQRYPATVQSCLRHPRCSTPELEDAEKVQKASAQHCYRSCGGIDIDHAHLRTTRISWRAHARFLDRHHKTTYLVGLISKTIELHCSKIFRLNGVYTCLSCLVGSLSRPALQQEHLQIHFLCTGICSFLHQSHSFQQNHAPCQSWLSSSLSSLHHTVSAQPSGVASPIYIHSHFFYNLYPTISAFFNLLRRKRIITSPSPPDSPPSTSVHISSAHSRCGTSRIAWLRLCRLLV